MHHLSASSKSQRGLTLIEAIAAIAVMAAMMTLVVSMTGNYTEDAKIAVTAQQIRTVGEAARGYINDNQATVAATATTTVPAVVTVAQLVAGGYLPAGFTETNNRSQTMCVLVLEPTANNLQGVVITQGGDTVDDVSLRQVSNLIGAAGGSIMSTATTTLSGTQGGWSMAIGGYGVRNCANAVIAGGPGAGHNVMSLWNGGNDVATAFLYRDAVTGRPDLNRMNTSIDMGGFRIVNLQAASPAAACGAGVNTGDLASAADGKVLSCQGGVWKEQGGGSAFWGDPVNQAVAMPACTAANANETRVRYGYAVAPTRRLFTCDGASWVAVGVDHAGNLAVPGDLTVTGATTLTGAVTANSGVTIGDGTAASSTNTLVLNRTATEGAACSPNGAVARDTNGLLLSCQSGVWMSQSKADFTTSWFAITTNAIYSVPHGFGAPPSRVEFEFSSDGGSTVVYTGWGFYESSQGWHFVKTDSPSTAYNSSAISIKTGIVLVGGYDLKPAANSMRILAWR